MSKKQLRICPDCRAQNVDEVNCWMCNRELPAVSEGAGGKPRTASKPVEQAHTALVALMMLMLGGTVTLSGMPFLSGLFLVPALFAVLLGMTRNPGSPEMSGSFVDRYLLLVAKLLKGILSATMFLMGLCVVLFVTCCVIAVIGKAVSGR